MVTWHCHKILYLAFVVTSLTRFIHDETSPLFDAFGVVDVHADVGDVFKHLRVVVVIGIRRFGCRAWSSITFVLCVMSFMSFLLMVTGG